MEGETTESPDLAYCQTLLAALPGMVIDSSEAEVIADLFRK
jgi:hypothetical protein